MTKHRVVVRRLEEAHVVALIVELDATGQILCIPLQVVLFLKVCGTFHQEIVRATEQDHRVGIDVRLELGGILLGKFFRVDFLAAFLLVWNLVPVLIDLLGLRSGLFRRYEEDFFACCVANRIAVKNVTSILAIVLAQSPAESLTHHFLRDLLLIFIALVVLVDFSLDIEWLKLILGGSLVLCQLLQLAIVVSLALSLDITVGAALLCAFSTTLGGFLTFAFLSSPLNVVIFLGTLIGLLTVTAHIGATSGPLLLLASKICLAGLFFLLLFLSCALLSKFGQSKLLTLPVVIFSLFLFVPVLNVIEYLFLVDVRHTVVLG